MMAISEVTVPVDVKMVIDKSTAEACLKIVELFMNQHRELTVEGCCREDGTINYSFKKKVYANEER